MSDNPHRLPRTVIPHRYELRLEPDLVAAAFNGSEEVTVSIRERTDEIVLNAVDLDIVEAAVTIDGRRIGATVSYDEPNQRATLHLAEPAGPGEGTVSLRFSGILNDQLHGFYRSTFTDVDGTEQVIATTQFEATDARRAFPCWDEPDLKAVFSITLVVPDDLLAVSNGPEIARRPLSDGRVEIRFADTMKMSTYLVAFVVGPFDVTEPVDAGGVPLRVVAPRGKLHLADYALRCGEFCLRYLADYYGIAYPGEKVDMVAIPDFAFGAMENLGCITFRESALLMDDELATTSERLRILDVIGHELAHMWFGDLVTMEWWDGIWLNEAFASFMELKATDAMRPDWKRWLLFAASERPWAFQVDALHSTRPVEFEVRSPDEANEMFDALTYGKGCSVLRMIEQFMGEDAFRDGVGRYLRNHAYANTVTEDLWAGLEGASELPVGEIMDTWIHQPGFPSLAVEVDDGLLRIRQRRFLTLGDDDGTIWKVPVQLRGERGGRPFRRKVVLTEEETTVTVDGPIDWVLANAGGHGFYRVAYDERLGKALIDRLEELEDLERYCLIDDAWAFVEAGTLTAAAYLELAAAYRDEREQGVWQTIFRGLGALGHHLVDDRHRPAFRRVVHELLAVVAARLGWQPRADEDDRSRRLRGQVVDALGRMVEDPDTVARCRELYERWRDDRSDLDPDVAQAALFTTAAHGDDDTYTAMFSMYESASTPQDQLKLLLALTLFDRESTVERTFEAVLDGRIRSQDAAWVVGRLLGGKATGPYAWGRVKERWKDLVAAMPPLTVRRMLEGASGAPDPGGLAALSDPEVAADVEAFFSDREMPGAQKALTQSLERLRANVALRSRERDRLGRYLAGRA